MPNHCYQQVYVEGPNFLVRQLWDGLTGNGYNPQNNGCANNPQFCQLVVPMPFEQWATPNKSKRMSPFNNERVEVAGWYDWRCENCGTKWDVVDVEIEEELTSDQGLIADKFYDGNTRSWFAFRCWTAWAPPTPVWDKLQKMGVRIKATYQDEGGMFEGEYINGYDRSWEPEFEEEEEAVDA